jgi:hypothetical protein
MITFNKINELYAEVLYNDVKIGNVENHLQSKTFTLEISYVRLDLKHEQRKLIGTLAKKIYQRLERRKHKERICRKKLRNSILNSKFTVKQ